MSNDNKVKMVTIMGDREVVIGEASPAQVRILTKKKHAKLVDGKLIVEMRPLMLTFGEQLKGDRLDGDPNISRAEIERRWAWFTKIMAATVNHALHPTQVDPRANLNAILAANPFHPDSTHDLPPQQIAHLSLIEGGANSGIEFRVAEDGQLIAEVDAAPPEQLDLNDEDRAWYEAALNSSTPSGAEDAWETAPDVYETSEANAREYSGVRFGSDEEEAAFIEQYKKDLAEEGGSRVVKVAFTPTGKRQQAAPLPAKPLVNTPLVTAD